MWGYSRHFAYDKEKAEQTKTEEFEVGFNLGGDWRVVKIVEEEWQAIALVSTLNGGSDMTDARARQLAKMGTA
jgi:hypothetical protein